ncbi:hypothetical protein [Brevibacillus laterosporus]|uniref:hypothetical protein n=1 Tax=Brevibacillus laterosporus TaxID=1465 RepID=UPI0018F89CD9|nr:hypothetical protein [Brevibacillus laterosporus]MBG9774256.1 hypothetical protein [Brevibacillus laterosporus]
MGKQSNIKTVNGVQYRVVTDRDAQVGDYVFYDESPRSYIEEGKPYEVVRVDSWDDPQIIDEEGDAFDTAWATSYELLEKIGTVPNELVTHEGVTYRKVTREAEPGEKIIVVYAQHAGRTYKNGDVLSVTSKRSTGVSVRESEVNLWQREYVVLEPASIDEELAAAQARVAELEAMKKKEVAEANRLKVGEYAKVVEFGRSHASVGQIVKVTRVDESAMPFRTENLDGKFTGWFYEGGIVRATDEEVAEAKRQQAFDQFKPGEKVRLVSGGGKIPLHGFENGGIYTVGLRETVAKVTIKRQDGAEGYANPDQLEKVTDEEAKWAALGREVGEFKAGDIVRLNRNTGGHPRQGDVTVLDYVYGTSIGFGGDYIGGTDWIEMVAPVESTVNLKAS